MAQLLVMFRFPRRDLVWWTWLVSTVLVFGIGCGAVLGEDRQLQVNETTEGCEHLLSDACDYRPPLGERSNGPPPLLGSLDMEMSHRLSLRYGTFLGQQGQFSDSGSQHVFVHPKLPVSKKGCNQVYFVDLFLTLRISSARGFTMEEGLIPRAPRAFALHVGTEMRGVFSNRTGRFCATFCIGDSGLGERMFLTPARLAYKLEHPDSATVPDTLVAKDCEIHIELEFPKATTMATNPLVNGVMRSLRSPDDPSYFHPLTISGISSAPYEFNTTVDDEAHILGAKTIPDISSGVQRNLKVWSGQPPFCAKEQIWEMFHTMIYSPIWNSSCSSSEGGLCSPFQNIHISRIVSSRMTIEHVQCTPDWRISAVFVFEFTQYTVLPKLNANESSSTATTEFLLVGEGYWDFYKPGQLVMVAHYLASNGTALDSKILITLQIPMARTIHHRYGIIGHVHSNRDALDPLHFASFSFVGDFFHTPIRFLNHHKSRSEPLFLRRYSYDYDNSIKTRIQPVCSLYKFHPEFHQRARFPDGLRASDLEVYFDFEIPGLLNNSSEYIFLINLAIDQEFLEPFMQSDLGINMMFKEEPTAHSPTPDPREIPVSFRFFTRQMMQHNSPLHFIEAEGFYDSITGHLCMLGCRRKTWEDAALPYEEDDREQSSSRCDLVFSIQYPPTNPRLWTKRPFVTGTICSLHDAGHPLYFNPLAINASLRTVYAVQRRWTFLRRHAETIMSLATLSLATFFIAIQAGYSSRVSNFKNLRFVSLVMLTVLTLGHLFPLLLSLNSFWTRSIPLKLFALFDRWEEAHEVIVRGTSMVALLLELRLLQLVWRSKTRAANYSTGTGLTPAKVSDVSVLQACLPIYATMFVVVGSVHWQLGAHQQQDHYIDEWVSVWADLQAFSGVILDLFLFPQVIANVLWDTKEKVAPLYPLFYLGMTVIRSAAHLFDALRASKFVPELRFSDYYFANPNWDLYSTTWDIVIPCCSVALAAVLFLQQRYGGRCFIPKSLRRRNYQLVGFQHVDI